MHTCYSHNPHFEMQKCDILLQVPHGQHNTLLIDKEIIQSRTEQTDVWYRVCGDAVQNLSWRIFTLVRDNVQQIDDLVMLHTYIKIMSSDASVSYLFVCEAYQSQRVVLVERFFDCDTEQQNLVCVVFMEVLPDGNTDMMSLRLSEDGFSMKKCEDSVLFYVMTRSFLEMVVGQPDTSYQLVDKLVENAVKQFSFMNESVNKMLRNISKSIKAKAGVLCDAFRCKRLSFQYNSLNHCVDFLANPSTLQVKTVIVERVSETSNSTNVDDKTNTTNAVHNANSVDFFSTDDSESKSFKKQKKNKKKKKNVNELETSAGDAFDEWNKRQNTKQEE